MKHLGSLNKYFRKYKWLLLLGIIFVILTNYFRILAPQITGYVVNTVVHSIAQPGAKTQSIHGNQDILVKEVINHFNNSSFREKILISAIILLVLALISGLFMFLMRQTIIVMSRHIEYDQKNEIYKHYQELDIAFYKTHSTGDLMNRISEDVSKVRMYTGPAIMYFINLAAVIGFSIVFMLRSDVHLTIVALSPLPVLALTIYFVNTVINRKSERIQSQLSDLTTNAQESYSGIRVIKSFVQENAMIGYFSRNAEGYRNSALSLAKTEAIYFPSIALLIGLSTLITIMVGGLDVVNQVPGASVGKIAEFVMYIQMLTFPVSAIGWTASMIQRAAVSQKRINEFLMTAPVIQNDMYAQDILLRGNITFSNADFTYPHTHIHALKNLNISITAGQKIGIVGRTGSGKSTLAQLMLRMYDFDKGILLFDGVPVTKIKLDMLRGQISYVPQDVFLFSDTIKNNILFGKEGTQEEVEKAATAACIHDEIMKFTLGYETIIGERGVTLSGGQKQRISIARALIKDPRLVIFDDCFNAVDGKTEKHIITNLSLFLKDNSAIIITHRIFSVFHFDNIIVLDNGRVAEMGTHEVLLAKNGLYAELYQSQRSGEMEQ